MGVYHGKSKRKKSGGRYVHPRKKRKYEMGRDPTLTRIREERKKIVTTQGGNEKIKLKSTEYANVITPEGAKKVKISDVENNPAHKQFTRTNIITKGAIINTEVGKVRVTSRPGQDGVVNGVLLEE